MHNREITHIVKTDSLSKTHLVVKNKCSFCCHLRIFLTFILFSKLYLSIFISDIQLSISILCCVMQVCLYLLYVVCTVLNLYVYIGKQRYKNLVKK